MNTQKTFLITGANSGLGFFTALGIAKSGGEVIMVCKNPIAGEQAKKEIIKRSGNTALHLFITDLSSQTQIRQLAAGIEKSFNKIDALINNAGCNFVKYTCTEDGIEMQFAVNHLAYFLLSNLLLKKLKNSPQGRIINVSSRAHARGNINFEDIGFSKNYSPSKAYNQSKLANILFTYELARKLNDTNVTVNCMHPGLMNTPIGNKNSTLLFSLVWTLFKQLGSNPENASETCVYLATSENIKNISGKYFANKKEIKSSVTSYNQENAKKLWQMSEELTGLKTNNEI